MQNLSLTARSRQQPRGFALVVAVMLMILLTIIAIGFLSLSSVTLRTSSQVLALSEARANARLALAQAIGELQRFAGPDQRITAPASILDSNPDTEAIDKVGEPNVTGVWESTKQEAGKAPAIPNDDPVLSFRRWLVSGINQAQTAAQNALSSSPFRNASTGVKLVGEHTSLDDDRNSSSHLWAGKIAIPGHGNTTNSTGHFAYAVMDEGVKARIDLAPPASMPSNELSRSVAGAPQRNAFDQIRPSGNAKGESLEPYQAARATINKAITLETAPLIQSGLPSLKPWFHDLTTVSTGVLADVSQGGMRKDLSLFGELTTLPTDYQKRRIYSDSDAGLAAVPTSSNYNGGSPDPCWSLVHDLLNLHKRVTVPNDNQLPTQTITSSLPANFRAGTDDRVTQSFQTINRDAQPVNPLAPVIVRCELMFSFFAKETKGHNPWEWDVPNAFGGGAEGAKWNHMLHLIYTPMVTLWNPYNVTLKLRQPIVEIANPPAAFRFIRQKSTVPTAVGEVTNRLVPLDEMYLYDWSKFDKKFVMQLFGQVSASGVTSGDVVLLPGEVKVFSPALDPNWNFAQVFDWQSNMTERANNAAQIKAAPGWRGPQYGFNIDWPLGDPAYVNSPRNGSSRNIGVVGSRIDDVWDVECGLAIPKKKDRPNIKRYAVSLLTSAGGTSPTSATNVLSRLEFDYNADLAVLTKALTPGGTVSAKIPFKMSEYSNPEKASNIRVAFNDPLKNWIVKPFMVLTAQAKSTLDSEFPAKCWIHNDATRPVSYQSLKDDHQAWNSHELALIQYKNGMATDAKIDADNRGYAFGGSNSLYGSSFFIHRELTLTPIQSVAQLSQFDLAGSPFPGGVDHAVGTSYAHPVIQSSTYQTGLAVDHAWLANTRLWDSWYASTFTNQRPYWPNSNGLKSVIAGFFANTKPLPNTRFSPWTGGRSTEQISGLLAGSGGDPQPDAYLKASSTQLLNGAFNVNSTSKAAWMAVLAGLDRETITSLLFDGTAVKIDSTGFSSQGPYLTRKRMPVQASASGNLANPERFAFWNGGCDLTRDELDALAAGIVREVKRRGPFRSVAEFVNRRIGPESDETLKGAIQAAIDDAPGIGDLNANTQGSRKDQFAEMSRNLTNAETNDIPYTYPQAACGQTAMGAGGALDQLAVLNQIGATICARSDTFRIRAYGDKTDASGKVLARAWCEAIVQRVPEYLVEKSRNGNDSWDSPTSTALHPINQTFGRRFEIRSFRWLSENDI